LTIPSLVIQSTWPNQLYLWGLMYVCLFLVQQPPVGQGLLIHEVSRSHATTHHSR
jgi:hypothetical protein